MYSPAASEWIRKGEYGPWSWISRNPDLEAKLSQLIVHEESLSCSCAISTQPSTESVNSIRVGNDADTALKSVSSCPYSADGPDMYKWTLNKFISWNGTRGETSLLQVKDLNRLKRVRTKRQFTFLTPFTMREYLFNSTRKISLSDRCRGSA
jgi:hypothetical protein